jgi:hypothetical protein
MTDVMPNAPAEPAPPRSASLGTRAAHIPWALYGALAFTLGLVMYAFGVLMVFPRYLLGLDPWLRPITEWLVWYSGVPLVLGLALVAGDLLLLLGQRRRGQPVAWHVLPDRRVTVALTAYNDEESIGPAVRDFLAHPLVDRVIVVSNNSRDRTFEVAAEAGAIAVNELRPGYGWCVYRCLNEALAQGQTDLIVLCEGDGTFRAFDIEKLVAYAPHADVVNGTRTVERLREPRTQLTTFMYYGNLFVGKLLEAKHVGRGTITDVGTTYKLIHRPALERLLPLLDPRVNLEFNAHLLDQALGGGFIVVECPITFHPRVGVSKGGNVSDARAMKVGLRMMTGIVLGWRRLAQG